MPRSNTGVRVLYSFAHRIGAGRICSTAYHQVAGLAAAGARVTVLAGSAERSMPDGVKLVRSLAIGRLRAPIRWVGRWHASRWHDWLTARWLERHAGEIDVFHGWPLGSLESLKVAKRLGIPSFLERPNAHTAFAYEVVAREHAALGFELPEGHDHKANERYLALEETEYRTADCLLCPSEFVARTFLDRGYPQAVVRRHQYGFDAALFRPGVQEPLAGRGLVVLYAGVGEPRKGLHRALEAWLNSGAHERGRFLVCGAILPEYRTMLEPLLAHPSVEVLGPRRDLEDWMRQADVLILSSIEEGSALVTYEARGAGCVLLVSDAAGAVCEHMKNALVHPAGDVDGLSRHIALVDQDRPLLQQLRDASLAEVDGLTWRAAGERLNRIYQDELSGR